MKTPKLRAQLDNHDEYSDLTGLDTGTEGGAKQSFKDECDINVILKRFGIGSEMPAAHRLPEAGDFTGFTNFHDAANAVVAARENFEQYPAEIRSKFDNDPGKFFDFATKEENREAMADLGLLTKEATERVRIAREQRAMQADTEAAERHAKRTQASDKKQSA